MWLIKSQTRIVSMSRLTGPRELKVQDTPSNQALPDRIGVRSEGQRMNGKLRYWLQSIVLPDHEGLLDWAVLFAIKLEADTFDNEGVGPNISFLDGLPLSDGACLEFSV